MCGIAGVVTWSEKHRIGRQALNAMSARIAHRGPDAEGIWLSPEAQITKEQPQAGLVHRRLAILDLDPRANQPFTDNRGRWIVFNGEIYNFLELRRELTGLKPHYAWRTTCDTEVLLLAYDTWGGKCVEHLNGMFAFAIWDPLAGELFCAVDRMGQKPLYWAASPDGGAVAFASELGALRDVPWIGSEMNPLALTMYLQSGYIPAPWTIYRDVFKLPPATAGVLAPGRPRLATYFDPNALLLKSPDRDASRTMRWRVRPRVWEAVKKQLVSDVPVGCFLSGGVDSSVIAAAMVRAADGNRVQTFTIGFDDPRYNETKFAAAVAKYLGTEHHEFLVRPNAVEDLPALAKVFGEPFADSSALPTHYLSRETKRFVKVALSGDGGDELFGGYDRYRAVAIAQRLGIMAGGLGVLRPLWSCIPGSHPKSQGARLKRLLSSLSLPPGERYLSYLVLFDSGQIDELLGGFGASVNQPGRRFMLELYDHYSRATDRVRAALAIDRISYLPGDLLVKLDRASMIHALEVRSPFMDHELVSFAAALSSKQLLKGGPKRMLRGAFAEDLPAWVFKRKKMGFAVPIGEWFKGELRGMLRDSLFASDSLASSHFRKPVVEKLIDEHEQGTQDHSQRLYSLLMLELWNRLNSSPRSIGS
jgi:asparagine synthase (glutamine-hydrolysing)